MERDAIKEANLRDGFIETVKCPSCMKCVDPERRKRVFENARRTFEITEKDIMPELKMRVRPDGTLAFCRMAKGVPTGKRGGQSTKVEVLNRTVQGVFTDEKLGQWYLDVD